MGLAASQVRLLSLTSRQHTVEHRAQVLMANKLRLSNDSDTSYEKYCAALDATKLETKTYDDKGKMHWIDGSLDNLMRYSLGNKNQGNVFYAQDVKTGKLYMPQQFVHAYDNSAGDFYKYLDLLGVGYTIENTETKYDDLLLGQYYEDIFNSIQAAGGCIEISEANLKSSTWTHNMVKNAQVVLTNYNRQDKELDHVSAASHGGIQEISNAMDMEQADIIYETELKEISSKETRYSTELNKLEEERNAIELQIDQLKQIAKDNIDKTFKLFS